MIISKIISKATAKTKLELPQTQLKEWENSVSEEAKKFHQQRKTLLSQIDKVLSGKLPFVKKTDVEALETKYIQFNSIVDDLITFFDSKNQLEYDITEYQQSKLNQGDQKLRIWLTKHCKRWQKKLSKLGDCRDESDINADDAELTIIQEEFTLYDKAVHLYQEANDILDTLNSGIDTAQLEADLPLFKKRLLENNPDELWLEELEALVSPLTPQLAKAQELAEQTASIIGNVSTKLNDLTRWSKQLNNLFKNDIAKLNQRHRSLNDNKQDIGEATQLEQDIEQLLEQLIAKAADSRTEQLAQHRQLSQELVQYCGSQPKLKDEINKLENDNSNITLSQRHKKWLADFQKSKENLTALINNKSVALQDQLTNLIDGQDGKTGLLALLSQLQEKRLATVVREQAENLEKQLNNLSRKSEDVLSSLQLAKQYQIDIQNLSKQADKDFEDITKSQQSLAERNSKNQEIANKLNLSKLPENLSERINGLTQYSNKEKSLEQAQTGILELKQELESQNQSLVEKCKKLWKKRQSKLNKYLELLNELEINTPIQATELPLSSNEPELLFQTITEMEELILQAQKEIKTAKETLKNKLEKSEQRLETETKSKQLTPSDKTEVDEFMNRLEYLAQDSADLEESLEFGTDLLEYLIELNGVLTDIDDFFLRRDNGKTEIMEHRKKLRKRLRTFKNQGLDKFFQKQSFNLISKVEALVFAEPIFETQWESLKPQLNYATKLFEQLENQGKWLAAQQLDEIQIKVEQKIQAAYDEEEEFVIKAKELLQKLKSYNEEELPPLRLRSKLERMAQA